MGGQANRPLPEGSVLENYRVLKLVAAGGTSFVYLAHDDKDAPVIIKEYLPATLPVRVDGEAAARVPEAERARFLFGMKDRKSTRLNSSHIQKSRMPSSA